MSDIRLGRQALLERILRGDGFASQAQREAAYAGEGLAQPLAALVSKVATHAGSLTDDDIYRTRASGLSEDQLFELVVCAAVGAAGRQYDAALEALAAAAISER